MKEKRKMSKMYKGILHKRKKNLGLFTIKKPSLGKLFAKYFAICMSILLLFSFVGTLFLVSYYREYKKTEFFSEQAIMHDVVANKYNRIIGHNESEEVKEKLWKSYVRREMNRICANGDYEIKLYDANTKEVLVETRAVTNLTLAKEIDEQKWSIYQFECPNEVMMDVMTDYEKEIKEKGSEWIHFYVRDIYVNGEEGIPGKIELRQGNPEGGEEIVLKEYDKTPMDTGNYTHIELEGDEWFKKLVPEMWEKVENKQLNEYIKQFTEDEVLWENSRGSMEEDFPWGGWYAVYDTVSLEDGKTVKIVMAVDVNLFEDYRWYLLLGLLCTMILSAMIAIAVAYRNYMLRLNHYQLDAYRREMTNVMAHDLKTPLMAISGYAQNLRENIHSDKKEYYADNILAHVEYMNEMIENILELAKVENHTALSEKETIHLNELTQEILKKYEILASDKNLKIIVKGEAVITADKTLMTQAVGNLISNAIKYAKENTNIQIEIGKDCLRVQNIMEHKLEVSVKELWKPFVKGDNSRNNKGTGVGLTIVKNIANLHGFELILRGDDEEFVLIIRVKPCFGQELYEYKVIILLKRYQVRRCHIALRIIQ